MENPDTWTELEYGLSDLFTQWYKDKEQGICGHSLVRKIADFIREREAKNGQA